ncbi:MAG: DinB family protein [Bacteroidetes bacterium]|nr:DinB family protein [Bacteroidota bacterium]
MNIVALLQHEMEQEAKTTRKFLSLIPTQNLHWKPHTKSMDMKTLAVHIAELLSWVEMALNTDGLDFAAQPYEPTPIENAAALLPVFESAYKKGLERLSMAKESELEPIWTLRNGETILASMSKYEVIRHAFSQITHHRAQLGVYLRLLDIAIPGSYGPSADEMK